MKRRLVIVTLAAAVLAFVDGRALVAQQPAAATPPAGSVGPYPNLLAINPLGIPFAIASVEYAGDLGGGLALGVNASYTGPTSDGAHWTTFEGVARYYPNERVFDGFSAGLTAGITSYSNVTTTGSCPATGPCTADQTRQSVALPSLGVVLDYDWLLGTRRRFVVGGGIGAKRLFGNTSKLRDLGGDVAYPTGRIVIGVLF